MITLRLCLVLLLFSGKAIAEIPAPILRSARDATQALGDQVRMGNVEASIAQMYPRWKSAMAKRMGSITKLEQGLKNATKRLQENGVVIENFQTKPPVLAYEVQASKILKDPNSEGSVAGPKETWLVVVPTVTILRIPDPGRGVNHRVEMTSYQVAISKKDFLTWSFIDGSTLTVADLRSLFPTLPLTLELPKPSRRALTK